MVKLSVEHKNKRANQACESIYTRAALQAFRDKVKSPEVSYEDKIEAQSILVGRNLKGSRSRQRNRCTNCQRTHGYFRDLGLCRLCFRKFALKGFLAGVKKSSW